MATTIRDVAREAGVSVATVSRVFNDSGPVHERTRARIREVARRLRYSPNGAARTLSMRRTHTVGVLLPDLFGEFFSEVIRGIDQVVQQSGWHLLVTSSHNEWTEIEAALRAMRGRVDGLIVMSPDLEGSALSQTLPDGLPVVLLNAEVDDRSYDSLNIDNRGGARAMVEHLLGLGHDRIGLVTGPLRNHDARERLSGSQAALEAVGAWAPERVVEGDFSEASGHAAAQRLLALTARPTALFAANDSMAIGALSAVRDAGLTVPGDVAITGFDDIPMARYMSPPLTTVRVSIAELGGQAVRRLFGIMEAGAAGRPRQDLAPTELVVRRSCGATA